MQGASSISRKTTVAVVGTGMAGLVSAYLLNHDPDQRFDVEVFEAQDRLSLDSASVSVSLKNGGRPARVDQPMRAFDGGFYPYLKAMYDFLGVDYVPQRFLFTYSRLSSRSSKQKDMGQEPTKPFFIHSSNNHRIPPLRPDGCGLLEWLSEIVYLAFCFAFFSICCFFVPPRESKSDDGKSSLGESLGEYLKRIHLPQYFVQNYLLPPLVSMSTCSHDAMLNFPASDVVTYIQRTYNAPHYLVSAGVQEVEGKLAQDLKINLGSRVTSVTPSSSSSSTGGVTICWESTTSKSTHQRAFDHVIIAVPPSAVGAIFAPLKQEMLHMPTIPVESVVHTDITPVIATTQNGSDDAKTPRLTSRYPSSGAQWIHMRTTTIVNSSTTETETIHEHPSSVLVTNNPQTSIDPSKIISRTIFTRTLRTPRSRATVNQIFGDGNRDQGHGSPAWRNGDGNVWLVGSWCWDGMVLLEGCVVSAMRVADALGIPVPWRS
ncbi:hypothetical protein VTO42DRAFT_1792 [Malbranchea cinnamomea]